MSATMQNKEIEEAKVRLKDILSCYEELKKDEEEGHRSSFEVEIEEIEVMKILLQYIDQLESKVEQLEAEKKKVIEKLENDIEEYRREMNNTHIKINQLHYMKRIEYAKEILEIMKGENDE